MKQRPALDDGFSSMSRREIRAMRREFAKLDRLGARERPALHYVPEQVPSSADTAMSAGSSTERGEALLPGSPLSLGEAVGRLRWSVVLLLLAGVLMTVATVLPGGWSRTESVPPAPRPSTAPLDRAPLGPGATSDPAGSQSGSIGVGAPGQTATAPTFRFEGPFGP